MSAGSSANSKLPSRCDVAIIGAGPIGLMLANLLGSGRRRRRRDRAKRRVGRLATRDRL